MSLPPSATRLLKEAGVELAVLFGSQARGRARQDSDVDIAVLYPTKRRVSLDERLTLGDELERSLGRPVDLVVLNDASTLLRYEVARGTRLYEAHPGAFGDFVARGLLDYDDLEPHLLRCGWGMMRRLQELDRARSRPCQGRACQGAPDPRSGRSIGRSGDLPRRRPSQ